MMGGQEERFLTFPLLTSPSLFQFFDDPVDLLVGHLPVPDLYALDLRPFGALRIPFPLRFLVHAHHPLLLFGLFFAGRFAP
jgi:hypothetical protein